VYQAAEAAGAQREVSGAMVEEETAVQTGVVAMGPAEMAAEALAEEALAEAVQEAAVLAEAGTVVEVKEAVATAKAEMAAAG
jgi:hypothetical protein